MSRNLKDLHPDIRWRAEKLIENPPVPMLIYFTLRTFDEQQELWEQGRSKPGKIVTNAKAGQSYHNYGLAFDSCPVDENGQPKWEDTNGFNVIGEAGECFGLQWGGRWVGFKDRPHLQISYGFTCHELKIFHELGGLTRVWQEIDKKVEGKLWP